MADWRELPVGFELDRIVAERLGWKDITEIKFYEENWYGNGDITRLHGYWDDGEDGLVPQYSTDANTGLPLETGEIFYIEQLWSGLCAAKVVRTVTGLSGDVFTGPTIAEVRAKAWLAWKEAHGDVLRGVE